MKGRNDSCITLEQVNVSNNICTCDAAVSSSSKEEFRLSHRSCTVPHHDVISLHVCPGDIMNLTVRDATLGATNTQMEQFLCHEREEKVKEQDFAACIDWAVAHDTTGCLNTTSDHVPENTAHMYLFSDATLMKNAVRYAHYALRLENSLSALPSLRKGAALHLAAMKIPETQIMLMTGHIHVEIHFTDTCDYGRQLTTEGVTAQDNAGHVLLLNHTNEVVKHQTPFSLGVNEVELYKLIRQMNNEPPITLPHSSQ